jgi:KaiC/GvpD/RAD55 family RecA-like ATPase
MENKEELKLTYFKMVDFIDINLPVENIKSTIKRNIDEKNQTLEIKLSDVEIQDIIDASIRRYENRHPKKDEDKITFLRSSDIVSKPIDWLWDGKIAKGKVTMIAGDPGLGKSQTTIFLAGVVSNGGTFPCGNVCKQGSVLFFSAEDDPEDTINPRLQAVGANLEKVGIFSTVNRKGKEKFFDLSKDIDLLEKSLAEMKDVSLIIVDPITAFLGDTDSHVNAEVRALLSLLSKVASKYGVAIVVVTHLNKSSGGSPLNKITGSLAFVAAARGAFMVIKDENDEQRRLFLTVKNNIASDMGGFAFKVEGVDLGNNIRTSRVVWEKEGINMSAIEAMKQNKDGDEGVDRKTIDWLESFLRKYPNGVSFDIVQKEAMRQGISKRTLYRAEKECFIDKVFNGQRKPKLWKLAFDEGNEINADDIDI